MLLQMALFHFLWLSNIPLYICSTSSKQSFITIAVQPVSSQPGLPAVVKHIQNTAASGSLHLLFLCPITLLPLDICMASFLPSGLYLNINLERPPSLYKMLSFWHSLFLLPAHHSSEHHVEHLMLLLTVYLQSSISSPTTTS